MNKISFNNAPAKQRTAKVKDDYLVWLSELENLQRSRLIEPPLFDFIVNEQLKRVYGVEDNIKGASMLFLFDNSTNSYKFVSSTAEQVLGYSGEEIFKNGFEWTLNLLLPADRIYKQQVMGDIFRFIAGLPSEQVRRLTVRYDIAARTKSGENRHFLEELMFPVISENGVPLLVTCFVHVVPDQSDKNTRTCVIRDPGLQTGSILFEKIYSLPEMD
jgi:PAS domain-containing protein